MRDIFASPARHAAAAVMDADQRVFHLFSGKAVAQGGVVRRSTRDVDRICGWDRFRAELRRRGFRAVLNGGEVVVFCNAEPAQILDTQQSIFSNRQTKSFEGLTG